MRKVMLVVLTMIAALGTLAFCPEDGPGNNCVTAQDGSCANPGTPCYQSGSDCVCRNRVAYTQCQCASRM